VAYTWGVLKYARSNLRVWAPSDAAPDALSRCDVTAASVFALLPEAFRAPLATVYGGKEYWAQIKAIIDEAQPAPPKVTEKPWPAAWEHVGPPEKPALRHPQGTAEDLYAYCSKMAVDAGMPPIYVSPTTCARDARDPVRWAMLSPDAVLFSLNAVVFLTKHDFEERPDLRKVLWDRFIEWRKANTRSGTDAPPPQRATHTTVAAGQCPEVPVPPPKPRRQSTLDIVKAAKAFVDEKRAEGWTREDFARGLGEMLGIPDTEKSK
jgi:hypothetical protein